MSNQHTGLPNTPEEIRAFIGMQFSSLQFGQENEQPHEKDTYTLTAHDLISAFQGLEIDAPVSAEPVVLPSDADLSMLFGMWGWRTKDGRELRFSHFKEMVGVLLGRYSHRTDPVAAQAQQVDRSPEMQGKLVDESPDLQGHASVIFAKAVAWADARVESALIQEQGKPHGNACDDAAQTHYELVQALRDLQEGQQPVSGADGLLESPTRGMSLGQRIAHVGGRENAQGYIEFGSPMAVDALIQHILRDLTTSTPQGAFQARYRMPGGKWSSWGAVTCGVKGHEQELRYLETEGQHIGGFDAWIKREYPHLGPIGDCVAIAREAWSAALAQQDADKVDAERYQAWRDALITGKTAEDDFIRLVADNLPTSVGVSRRPTAAEWDAAIDAARKEPDQ